MRLAVLTVSLLGLVVGISLEAAEPGAPGDLRVRVAESSRGDLAFRTAANGGWKVARRGETLPAEAFLRTSAAGSCRVELKTGILQLAPETQAQLLTNRRQIVVSSGHVFVQSLTGWSIRAGTLNGNSSADAAVEFAAGSNARVSVKALTGTVAIAGEGVEPITLNAGQSVVQEQKAAKPTQAELTNAEIERLRALTDPPRKPQGLGQLVVNDPQSNSPVRLNLARYHVNVVLHPPVALVQIDQSFYNPYPRQQEGTFVFNLPEGASVSRFAMYTTPAQLVEGELIEREKAANIYQSIVNRQRDPAILEQIGGSLFRMRVFPIFARDTKRILLDYTVPIIEQDDGHYAFELPLMSDLEPVWDFSITGTIRGPNVAGTAHSVSHPAATFQGDKDGAVTFALRERLYRPEGAFEVEFRQRAATEATVRSFAPAAKGEPAGEAGIRANEDDPEAALKRQPHEFLATVSPAVLGPAAQEQRAAPSPAEVLILADTSGGTTDRVRLRQMVRTIAGALRAEDRFRLGCVDVGFRPVTKEWVQPGSTAATAALAQFEREFFLGETDFEEGLSGGVNSLPDIEQGRRRHVIYVGDGVLLPGQSWQAESRNRFADLLNRRGARFSAVLTDSDPSGSGMLEQLAAATGGRLFRAGSAGASGELFEWVLGGCPNAPRISAVRAEGVAADDLFLPTAWVPGRSLHIFGRRNEAGPLKLEIEFERDGKTESRRWTLNLKNDPDDLFVGRLWGQRKLDRLRSLAAGQNDEQERRKLVQQIVGLSQEWTLLSPYTAFLVLENESEYPKYGIRRQFRHHYWKPAEAVAAEPLPKEALEVLKTPARTPQRVTAREFGQALKGARQALDRHAPRQALLFLESVAHSPLASSSDEFKSLQRLTGRLSAQEDMLRHLGPQRGWFDRKTPIGFDTPTTELVWQMLAGYGSASGGIDPRLAVLGKPVSPPAAGITLEDFPEWLQKTSGLEVWLDKATLADEGVATDQELDIRGIRSMSLESLLKHVLTPTQLTYVFEDDVLKITTSAKAGEKLMTHLYPVSDLVQSTRSTDYSLLVNADVDRELLSKRRLNDRLSRKIAVEFDDLPLEDAFDFLAGKIDDNLIIDRSTLADEGVALDQPITMKVRDLPIRSVLAQLCEPLQLTFSIDNEAIVITTSARAGEKLETRFHSGQGIVFELPPELVQFRRPKPQGIGGGFGGMGGFGGGMMGGMGMAGMAMGGAMMGGFGQGGGAPAAPPGNATVSESAADGDVLSTADTSSKELPESDSGAPADEGPPEPRGIIELDRKSGLAARRLSTTTAPDTINLIEQTIQPDSWEALSGPGSILYYPGAVGFAIRQTPAVHEEIEDLLDRIRKLPPAFTSESGYVPAKIPAAGPGDIDNWDIRTLVQLLESVIQPDTWEDLSGPGSIDVYAPKLALSIRQTQEIHREIRNLLTVLRRARYLARQGRSWKSFNVSEGPWFTTVLGLTDLPARPRQSELPEPEAGELQALAILREPLAGQQTWRSIRADGHALPTTVIRGGAVRSEFEFEGRLARVEEDEAAVAYPGLGLVERGAWGEALRRMVDGRLPWLPHRSRRDLARLFRVTVASQDEKDVKLRLELPGAAAGNDMLVTVSRERGLPTFWESRMDAKPVLRLRFENLDESRGQPRWKRVIAEDATGREVERWELVEDVALNSDIPPLDGEWDAYFVVDLRDQERAHSHPAMQMLQSVRLRDWNAADRALAEALVRQPDQPFLLVLKAWSMAQRGGGREAEVVELFKKVLQRGGSELVQSLADRSFGGLDDGAIYEILLAQPIARRRAADWDRLARAAVRIGKPHEAVEHLKAAVEQAGLAGDDPERARLLVELLLETRHVGEAVALAEARAARSAAQPEEVAALAEALHQWGAVSEASQFMRQALAQKDLTGERRQKLLHRRASLETGPVRWRTLLEAIDAVPADSPLRAASIDAILADLTDPAQGDQAGRLGEEAKDKRAQAAFRVRQAELYLLRANLGAAADIGWSLYESKRLPAERFGWLFGRLHAARQNERLIRLAEDRLRAGQGLPQNVLDLVASAYEATGRPDAARRARTNSRDIKPPPAPAAPAGNVRGGGFFSVR